MFELFLFYHLLEVVLFIIFPLSLSLPLPLSPIFIVSNFIHHFSASWLIDQSWVVKSYPVWARLLSLPFQPPFPRSPSWSHLILGSAVWQSASTSQSVSTKMLIFLCGRDGFPWTTYRSWNWRDQGVTGVP